MLDIDTSSFGTENRLKWIWFAYALDVTWESGMTEGSFSKSLSSSTCPNDVRLVSRLGTGGLKAGEADIVLSAAKKALT
jgi:hypothetical protein